jgi:hypothetical protein
MLYAWSTLALVLLVGTGHLGWWIVALMVAVLAAMVATRNRN